MLLALTIRNIALIENLTIPMYEGFHVLTGETGAGKSIVVDAVNLVLGGRADRELIRTGCDKAYVEAIFNICGNEHVKALLAAQELEAEEDILSISREITVTGKNICRICGIIMPILFLRELTAYLVDVHGQHEHQFLMDERKHLPFLDGFGDGEHRLQMDFVLKAYEAYHATSKELVRLTMENAQREQRMDILRFQMQELKNAKLEIGEEEALKKELERFRHSEKISATTARAYDDLYAGSGKQSSALALLRDAASVLNGISGLDADYASVHEKINELYYELEDIGLQLRAFSEAAEFDPERNEEIEARLDLLRRLGRKYGSSAEEMIFYLQKITDEFHLFEHMDESLDELRDQQNRLLVAYQKAADLLTDSRKRLALWFESEMVSQLKQLGMGKTRFAVSFLDISDNNASPPQATGNDQVAFLISPNPGEPLKPLAKIASGGELSRLMLAIKSIAAEQGLVSTMVFDEIDTGISGQAAQVVAEKIARISAFRQVICVTHLPQIAAMADHHFLVSKFIDEGRTYTSIDELGQEDREKELARMVGGIGLENDTGLNHAKSMLLAAHTCKQKILEEKNQELHNPV